MVNQVEDTQGLVRGVHRGWGAGAVFALGLGSEANGCALVRPVPTLRGAKWGAEWASEGLRTG